MWMRKRHDINDDDVVICNYVRVGLNSALFLSSGKTGNTPIWILQNKDF